MPVECEIDVDEVLRAVVVAVRSSIMLMSVMHSSTWTLWFFLRSVSPYVVLSLYPLAQDFRDKRICLSIYEMNENSLGRHDRRLW